MESKGKKRRVKAATRVERKCWQKIAEIQACKEGSGGSGESMEEQRQETQESKAATAGLSKEVLTAFENCRRFKRARGSSEAQEEHGESKRQETQESKVATARVEQGSAGSTQKCRDSKRAKKLRRLRKHGESKGKNAKSRWRQQGLSKEVLAARKKKDAERARAKLNGLTGEGNRARQAMKRRQGI